MVEVDVSDLVRALRRYENKIQNLPMDVLGQILVNEADEIFQTEGASGSDGKWEALMDSTIARSPRRDGGQILQDTGATATVQVTEVSGFSVSIGSTTAYGGFHITGTQHMPKRDFFAFNFADVLDQIGDATLQEFQR